MRMEITGISRQKEDLSVQERRKLLNSRVNLLWGQHSLIGAGYTSNLRLHLHLNEIKVVDT